mgnify:CR=1 FL=1
MLFETVVKIVKQIQRYVICVWDDFRVSPIYATKIGGLQSLLDKQLRTSRHSNQTQISLNHQVNAGNLQKQLSSTVRWRVMFPRSQKFKISRWISDRTDLPIKEARLLVQKIGATSRWLGVHLFSPQFICGEIFLTLV